MLEATAISDPILDNDIYHIISKNIVGEEIKVYLPIQLEYSRIILQKGDKLQYQIWPNNIYFCVSEYEQQIIDDEAIGALWDWWEPKNIPNGWVLANGIANRIGTGIDTRQDWLINKESKELIFVIIERMV